jgi:hypothetical protein
MDPILIIIGVVVFLLVMGIILSLIKGVIRIIFSIFTIVMLVVGVSLILDVNDFRKNFLTEEKKMILVEDNNILAGFIMTTEDQEPTFLTKEEIDAYSSSLQVGNLDAILGDSYKVMVLDLKVFEELPIDLFDIQGNMLSKEAVISVFRSDNPGSIIEEELGATYQSSDSELKGAFFGLLFNEVMTSPVYFLEKYKEKDISIYPETMIFKAIGYIPIGFVKGALEKALSTVKDKIPIEVGA